MELVNRKLDNKKLCGCKMEIKIMFCKFLYFIETITYLM
jgi:hypothetical protein